MIDFLTMCPESSRGQVGGAQTYPSSFPSRGIGSRNETVQTAAVAAESMHPRLSAGAHADPPQLPRGLPNLRESPEVSGDEPVPLSAPAPSCLIRCKDRLFPLE